MLRDIQAQRRSAVLLALLMVFVTVLSSQLQAADVFRVGDLLLANNNGKYQFIRVSGSGPGASFQLLDVLSDGTANNTAGCTFSPMFRPITTSFASGTAPSLLERYQVSDVGTPHPVTVSTDTSAGGGFSGKSVAMDVQGSVYVGHAAGNGEIDQYIQPGPGATQVNGTLSFTLGAQFAVGANVDAAGSEWLDVTSIAAQPPTAANPYVGYNNDLYYTSGGLNIYLLTFATNPSNTPPPTSFNIQKLSINLLNFKAPAGFAYHGVKILADSNANPTALIVAAGPKIVLFVLSPVSSARLSTVYDYSRKPKNTPNWQSIAVDSQGTGFWATDQANNNIAHFSIVFSGNPSKFITASPDTTLKLPSTPYGVCVDGSFSPGQPKLQNVGTATLTVSNPTFTFNIPNLYPTFYPTQTSPNTFTVGATFAPPVTSAQAKLFSLDFDPTNNEGVSDDATGTGTFGFPCLKTAPPPPLNVLSPYCEAYKVETTPNVGQGISLLDLDIFVLQQTTSAFATPPATPGPQPFGINPEYYHDGNQRVTLGLLQDETRIKSGASGTGSTVFTIQTQTNTEGISCGYQPPFAPLSTDPTNAPIFGSGSTASLKFQAALNTNPIDCQNGTFLNDLNAELRVLKLNPGNLNSSTDVTSQFDNAGCSSQCTGLFYVASGSQSNPTWNLQVKMPTGPDVSGTYIAYTTDHNNHIPDFSAYFCIDVCSQPAP